MSTEKPRILRFAAAWILQFSGALLLMAGLYWWLTWPDEESWQVAASAVAGLVLLLAFVCIQRTVFAAPFGPSGGSLPWLSLSACAAFAVWLAIFALLEVPLVLFQSNSEIAAVRLAQLAHLPPRATTNALNWVAWTLIWLLLPALMLPLGSILAHSGFTGLRSPALNAARAIRRLRYWVGLVIALGVGVCAPVQLIGWIPERQTLRGEFWSAGLRLGLGYLLAITALVFVAWNTANAVLSSSAATTPPQRASAIR